MSTQTEPSSNGEAQTTPVLFHHCVETYNAMNEEAKTVTEKGEKALVYEGHLTRLITQQLGLAVPYYTSVTKALKGMKCIRQLRRGGGNATSQWELIKAPTEEDFINIQPPKIPRQDKMSAVQQQVRDLNHRVNELENFVKQITGGGN